MLFNSSGLRVGMHPPEERTGPSDRDKVLCARLDLAKEELKPREEVIGQVRAVSDIEFGLSIRNRGYNIFASGVPGIGRITIIKSIVKRISLDRPVPEEWCSINNCKDPDRPLAV
jgi:hypothetical protein